jgi:hypothetical protein
MIELGGIYLPVPCSIRCEGDGEVWEFRDIPWNKAGVSWTKEFREEFRGQMELTLLSLHIEPRELTFEPHRSLALHPARQGATRDQCRRRRSILRSALREDDQLRSDPYEHLNNQIEEVPCQLAQSAANMIPIEIKQVDPAVRAEPDPTATFPNESQSQR